MIAVKHSLGFDTSKSYGLGCCSHDSATPSPHVWSDFVSGLIVNIVERRCKGAYLVPKPESFGQEGLFNLGWINTLLKNPNQSQTGIGCKSQPWEKKIRSRWPLGRLKHTVLQSGGTWSAADPEQYGRLLIIWTKHLLGEGGDYYVETMFRL